VGWLYTRGQTRSELIARRTRPWETEQYRAEIEYELAAKVQDNRYKEPSGELETGFNLGYLRDAVNVPEDELTLCMMDVLMPLGIRTETRLAAVMPMRI